MRIDSHQHFWLYSQEHFPWMDDPKFACLRRNFMPEDLTPLLQQFSFDGSIAVQVRESLEETQFLLELATHYDFVKGVVGWVDLYSPKLKDQLANFANWSKFVGVRHMLVQDGTDDDLMLTPIFKNCIAMLKEFNLTYDLLLLPKHIPAAIKLAKEFPEQRFVVNHIAKPAIKDLQMSPWQTDISELGQLSNVYCKLSGMVTEAKWKQWRKKDFYPYLDIVIATFGTDRVMIGSDWPVCILSGDYMSTMSIVMEYIKQFPAAICDKILGDNCMRFYGIQHASYIG